MVLQEELNGEKSISELKELFNNNTPNHILNILHSTLHEDWIPFLLDKLNDNKKVNEINNLSNNKLKLKELFLNTSYDELIKLLVENNQTETLKSKLSKNYFSTKKDSTINNTSDILNNKNLITALKYDHNVKIKYYWTNIWCEDLTNNILFRKGFKWIDYNYLKYKGEIKRFLKETNEYNETEILQNFNINSEYKYNQYKIGAIKHNDYVEYFFWYPDKRSDNRKGSYSLYVIEIPIKYNSNLFNQDELLEIMKWLFPKDSFHKDLQIDSANQSFSI